MPLVLYLMGSFLVLILSLIAAQATYFERNWKLYALAVLLSLISGACIFNELAQWFIPPPPHEPPTYMRFPTTPL